MKRIQIACVVILAGFALFTQTSHAQFDNHKMFLGPVVVLATDPVGFGAELEVGVSDNVGVGGMIRYWGKSFSSSAYDWKWSIIMPQVVGYYHFMPRQQLDPYAGARLGYAIYSSSVTDHGFGYAFSDGSAGGMFLNAAGGLRYFFNHSISVNGSLEFRIAGTDYFGGSLGFILGLDFTL